MKWNNNKKPYKKSYCSKNKRHFVNINYFYCNQRGHHIKDCFYRNGSYVLKPNEKGLLKLPHLKFILCVPLTLLDPKSLGYYIQENDCFFCKYVGDNQSIFGFLIVDALGI